MHSGDLRLISSNWSHLFRECAKQSKTKIRIISPFIKLGALETLLKQPGVYPHIITRFNLNDCAAQVNDIEAMRFAIKRGGRVRGIKGLHAKLYIFDDREALITSANLTGQAQSQNQELGVHTSNAELVQECITYFDDLWNKSESSEATEDKMGRWDKEVRAAWESGYRPKHSLSLKDYGVTIAGVTESMAFRAAANIPVMPSAERLFVKFTGTGDDRCDENTPVIAELARSGSHWVACFPATKRPRQIKNGDIVFISRMVRENNDYRVYGYGTAITHDPVKHNASKNDMQLRTWMRVWPRQIRLQNTHFIAGPLANGVSLAELMDKWGSNSFEPTRKNKIIGTGNTSPRGSLQQKAHMELTHDASLWLWQTLRDQIALHGELSQDYLEQLDWPDKKMDQHLAAMALPQRARALLKIIVEHTETPEFNVNDSMTYLGYKEALDKLNISAKSHFGRVLQHQGLNDLYQWVRVFSLPAITGLIVNKIGLQSGLPSERFFESYDRSLDDLDWWKSQVKQAIAFHWDSYILS